MLLYVHRDHHDGHLDVHTAPELCTSTSFNAVLRPKKPKVLLGTWSPGLPSRRSHTAREPSPSTVAKTAEEILPTTSPHTFTRLLACRAAYVGRTDTSAVALLVLLPVDLSEQPEELTRLLSLFRYFCQWICQSSRKN